MSTPEVFADHDGKAQDTDQLLADALIELDRAHVEIARILKVSLNNLEKIEELEKHFTDASTIEDIRRTTKSLSKVSSRYYGVNALELYIKEKRYDQAHIWAKAISSRLGGNLGFLRSLRNLQTKRGQITSALALTYKISAMDRTIPQGAIMQLEGRVRELDGWTPRISGPRIMIENPIKNRVLHLVKESRPFLSNGFTSRSHKNFLAEKKAGLDPIVMTEPGFPSRSLSDSKTVQKTVDGIPHIRLGQGPFAYDRMPVDEYIQLFADLAYKEIQHIRPAYIHASSGRRGYETALVGLALKEKTGIPLIYEVRSFFEANWTGDSEWETTGEIFTKRMLVEEECMRQADRVLTICDAMKQELMSRGIPESKIGIIPNAVDVVQFTPRMRSESLAERWGIGQSPTFGYVSNMDHYRESQETLIEACALLKKSGSDAKCILVGSGPRLEQLKSLADTLGVRDRVVFTGSVDHNVIDEYYSLIDVFVVPRIRERAAMYVTPLKPFEAMAQKKPVIVSDLPALNEIADVPRRGLNFPPGDAEALASLLSELFIDPERLGLLAEAGYKWVHESRTWDHNGMRYVEQFEIAEESAK